MIPYPYNMVDMGGIDLAEANGTVVEGLYDKIVEAVNACGDVVLYNWKFASIEIAPQHTQILLGVSALTINTLIQVTEQDAVTVLGIAPPPPPVVPVEPLNVYENGVYTATPPASGFNPVTVAVPSKVLVPLSVTENGEYDPVDYEADGFSTVEVNVEGPSPRGKNAIHIWTKSTGGGDASLYVQGGEFSDKFTPLGFVVTIPYAAAAQYTNYGIVDIRYSASWYVKADTTVIYDGNTYQAQEVVRQWAYSIAVDMLVVEV